MGQVTIALNGRSYRLSCGDGEEPRLLALAAEIRERLDTLAIQFGQIGDERLLVMAALLVADELWDVRQRLAEALAPVEAPVEASVESGAEHPACLARGDAPRTQPLPQPDEINAAAGLPEPPAKAAPSPPNMSATAEPPVKRTLRRPVAPQRPSLEQRLAEAREASLAADLKAGNG